MLHLLVEKVLELVADMGYTGIFLMMTIESSFIPFPSEVAMIPAGYLSSTGEMLFPIAFLAGTLGALAGSSINYILWYYLWGPTIKKLVHSYGKYIFLKEEHYEKSEVFFQKHGAITTFVGRFIPAVRQLISLPAGIFKMNLAKFFFYTSLGAGIWNLVLMTIGYIAGENRELIAKYSKEALILTAVIIVCIIAVYILKEKQSKK